jgi:predicted regulator of Ras-like GTPase activity (Roadblock/LC7/MglB family)
VTGVRNWDYLLNNLCDRVPGITHALAVSADGLKIAYSAHLPVEQADKLAAFTSGMTSLNTAASQIMRGGPVEQNVTEMEHGFMIVMAIGDGSSLTILAPKQCDLGQISFHMARLINDVGATLTPSAR